MDDEQRIRCGPCQEDPLRRCDTPGCVNWSPTPNPDEVVEAALTEALRLLRRTRVLATACADLIDEPFSNAPGSPWEKDWRPHLVEIESCMADLRTALAQSTSEGGEDAEG